MSEKTLGVRNIVIATVNVNGLPRFRQDPHTRSSLAPFQVRFPELCRLIEASDIAVVNFQEVFTNSERKMLARHLPTFRFAVFEPAAMGPKGGLVTFSKTALEKFGYESFRKATKKASRSGLPPLCLTKSSLKGVLISKLKDVPLTIVNAHPLANYDWDWSPQNRFHSLESAQLSEVASVARSFIEQGGSLILGADLNVARPSELFTEFMTKSGLRDASGGDTLPTFQAEFMPGGMPAPHIDYLLIGGDGISVGKNYRIFENKLPVEGQGDLYLTDHLGLVAELTISQIHAL